MGSRTPTKVLNAGWDSDPLLRLAQLADTREWVEAELEDAISRCRKVGISWGMIAQHLGVTRQSAHRKYAQL